MASSLELRASSSWFVPSAEETIYSRILSFSSCHSVFVAKGEFGSGFFLNFQPQELLNILPLKPVFFLVAYLAQNYFSGNTGKCVYTRHSQSVQEFYSKGEKNVRHGSVISINNGDFCCSCYSYSYTIQN